MNVNRDNPAKPAGTRRLLRDVEFSLANTPPLPPMNQSHASDSREPHRAPPLAGMRILAVEQYGAGPFGTSYLADLGAEVIKIENPAERGDVGRHVGPYFFGPDDSHFFHTFNRNKRSLTLDLKQPEGMRVFQRLVAGADAVLDNLRGDLPARLGITYDALKEFNPRIVCAHLSAYGREGSRATWPGYDYLMQAEAGHMTLTGEPNGPPTRYGLSIVDLMTGLVAAFGLLAAVCSARSTGVGSDVAKRVAAPLWGGLISLTILTLAVIPAFYVIWRGYQLRRAPADSAPPGSPAETESPPTAGAA